MLSEPTRFKTDNTITCLFTTAQGHAQRRGLRHDDAEDCATDFVMQMLLKLERMPPLKLPEVDSAAWLHRCADNFVKNFLRSKARLRRYELSWPELVWSNDSSRTWDCPDNAPGPEAHLLRTEFWKRLKTAAKQLEPAQRKTLSRYYLRDWSVNELAAASGHMYAEAKQRLYRARKRFRRILERQGFTEAERDT